MYQSNRSIVQGISNVLFRAKWLFSFRCTEFVMKLIKIDLNSVIPNGIRFVLLWGNDFYIFYKFGPNVDHINVKTSDLNDTKISY